VSAERREPPGGPSRPADALNLGATFVILLLSTFMGGGASIVACHLPVRVVRTMEGRIRDLVRELQAAHAETELTAEIPRAIAQTLDGVTRVATIVRALKELAHPDQSEKVVVDLNRAVQNTVTVARNEVKDVADVELELGELPLIRCHPGSLNRVFLNLLVNAGHAIADVVAGTEDRGRIRISTRRDGGMAVVEIADTGGGIPEGIRDRIFDPFFTTKPVGRGSGQGLAIARSIVTDKHGGTLTFESAVGCGTTFRVRLPVDGGSGIPPDAPGDGGGSPGPHPAPGGIAAARAELEAPAGRLG
jgi:signal transduction histidine kinase